MPQKDLRNGGAELKRASVSNVEVKLTSPRTAMYRYQLPERIFGTLLAKVRAGVTPQGGADTRLSTPPAAPPVVRPDPHLTRLGLPARPAPQKDRLGVKSLAGTLRTKDYD